MNTDNMANKLKNLRHQKKMTQHEMAKALGISPSSYSMYEAGLRVPSDSIKIKIAEFHGKTVQFIFFR